MLHATPACPAFILQLAHNAPTQLVAGPDGKPRVVHGLEGFDREFIKKFLEGCAIKNDQANSKKAEQPAPHPIATDRPFQHTQVSTQTAMPAALNASTLAALATGRTMQSRAPWVRSPLLPHSRVVDVGALQVGAWLPKHQVIGLLTSSTSCSPSPASLQADLLDMGDGVDPRFRYVLVIIDLFTRHVWLRPLKTKEAVHVAREVSGSGLGCH